VIWVRLFFVDLVKLASENLLNGDVHNDSLAFGFHRHGLVFLSTASESCFNAMLQVADIALVDHAC
jgi:hypothetical protein